MASYRLVDSGYSTFKKIVHDRRWVGRVGRLGDGSGFFGKIGDEFVRAPTEVEAFELVVAKRLGYANAAALRARNAAVRRANAAARARGRAIANDVLAGDFRGAIDIIEQIGSREEKKS